MKTFIYPTVRVVEFQNEEVLTESMGIIGDRSFSDENAVEIQGGYYFDEEEY